ncbi:hypothetical protein A4X13_0g2751 [Tilletia indica]|uniref:GrpE protein homolog n=1 Tax=Tilletia indica TaxID=43049 RepID=A0A177TJH3_9BASI|nr:hypothetical protein A4X13_0g2751 [Tilletia indica]
MFSSSSSTLFRAVARQSRNAGGSVAPSSIRAPPASSSSSCGRTFATSTAAGSLVRASARLPHQRAAAFTPLSIRAFSSCPPRRSDKDKDAAAAKEGDKAASTAEGASKEGDAHAVALKEKDAKIKELSDTLLYARADMQNLIRRSAEDKTNASDYAITKLARDLTSSLDILQIALRSVPDTLRKASSASSDASSETEDPRRVLAELYSGLELTERSLLDMLKSHGVTEFDPTGEKFDPALHEALYQAPIPGKTPGTVLECSKRGYKIKNRILRPAQVGVVQGTD